MLVSGPVAQEKLGIWVISVIGASLKKIRDDAWSAALSPDDSQIAFTSDNADAIWLMNADGSNARAVIKGDSEHRVCCPQWFPKAGRLLYYKWTAGDFASAVTESRSVDGGDPRLLLPGSRLRDLRFVEADTLIYSRGELPPNQYDSNLWRLRIDPATGKPKGARRLTEWTGFDFENLALTADAKRLVFLRSHDQSDVYTLDLGKPAAADNLPRRLTLSERYDWPGGWLDNKTVLFDSNRNGSFDIYKQAITERDATPLVTGPEEKRDPQLSPDGKWILYLQWPKPEGETPAKSGKLMRIAATGGPPEPVLDFNGQPELYLTLPGFACPRAAGASCVIFETEGNEIKVSSFDPVMGRQKELRRIPVSRLRFESLSLSPEGTRIAMSSFDYKEGNVEVFPLAGGDPMKLSAQPWAELDFVAWAADGKSLFLSSRSSRGVSVVRLPLAGKAGLVLKSTWDNCRLVPSPDGRTLALGPRVDEANAWMIPSFPAKR